ncbi:MAG: hypothetical protein NVS2B17_31090 [Candidatus Velthaea sp.]
MIFFVFAAVTLLILLVAVATHRNALGGRDDDVRASIANDSARAVEDPTRKLRMVR